VGLKDYVEFMDYVLPMVDEVLKFLLLLSKRRIEVDFPFSEADS